MSLPAEKCELKFKPTARKPVDYHYGPRSVAIGDFNADTHLDMVVTYHIANKIAVYLGDGHGAFLNETLYSTGSRSNPYMVAVVNFGTNSIGIFH